MSSLGHDAFGLLYKIYIVIAFFDEFAAILNFLIGLLRHITKQRTTSVFLFLLDLFPLLKTLSHQKR